MNVVRLDWEGLVGNFKDLCFQERKQLDSRG
jgi:hypothetical protein